MMLAAVRTANGVAIERVPVPVPREHEVLVRVRASSLNRADLSLVDGGAHGALGGAGTVLGLEWAGHVVRVGSAVPEFAPGDRVMCSGIGGFAEYALADWRRVLPYPTLETEHESAACLSIALRTGWLAMREIGQLQSGESVLVLGATSGVGLMCLQLARELGASNIIGTTTQAARRARLSGFGATASLDSRDPGWAAQVLDLTHGKGVDLLIDFLAGPHINESMRATRLGGRIVNVGRMAGETGSFDFDLHSMRRIQYLGTTFRTRSASEVGEINARMRAALWPALAQGRLALPVDIRLPLHELVKACELMRKNAHFGKIVLTQT